VNTTGAIATNAVVTVNNTVNGSGTVYFNDPTPVIGSLSGSGYVQLNESLSGTITNLTINNSNIAYGSASSFSGSIQDQFNIFQSTGIGAITLTGGSLSLSGVNTYTGGTSVTGGTLLAMNAFSSTGTGPVIVTTGGRIGGTGATGNSTGNPVSITPAASSAPAPTPPTPLRNPLHRRSDLEQWRNLYLQDDRGQWDGHRLGRCADGEQIKTSYWSAEISTSRGPSPSTSSTPERCSTHVHYCQSRFQ